MYFVIQGCHGSSSNTNYALMLKKYRACVCIDKRTAVSDSDTHLDLVLPHAAGQSLSTSVGRRCRPRPAGNFAPCLLNLGRDANPRLLWSPLLARLDAGRYCREGLPLPSYIKGLHANWYR
jgi:hypothetical protein